jgi:hypothetical protein
LVRMKGLEPSRLAALAPKASVSTIPPHPRGLSRFVKTKSRITIDLMANELN